jgi:DNA helicase-2/ATP-dependent DNA helicase PcrA
MQGRFDAEDRDRSFAVGERVFHPKFGYGRIRSADGDRLEIEFEKAGPKRVLASFVEPA